jgi:hypothetical protein
MLTVHTAIQIRQFLDTTASQLTYPGLFALASALPAGEPVALFRASHLAVLYKPAVAAAAAAAAPAPEPASESVSASSSAPAAAGPSTSTTPAGTPGTSAPDPGMSAPAPANALYALVTDAVFARERAVVWEALGDVDGQTAAFVDGAFAPARAAGGDFAGLELALDGDAAVPPEEEVYECVRASCVVRRADADGGAAGSWRSSYRRRRTCSHIARGRSARRSAAASRRARTASAWSASRRASASG